MAASLNSFKNTGANVAELIIGDHTPITSQVMNAGMRGLIPRDPIANAVGYSAVIPPAEIVPYSHEVMVEMIADSEKSKSRLSDILLRGDAGKPIPSTDQNGQGYCWFYGFIGALQAVRAKHNLPYKQLSGHAGACKVKGFRDEGGWGALGLEFGIVHGCPDTDHWPEKSMNRKYDTPETWANAKLYMPGDVYADIASPVYNRDLSAGQQLRCVIDRNPTINDYDFWGHCTFGCDAVNGETKRTETRADSGKLATLEEFDLMWGMNDPVTGGLGIRSRNSWKDSYGDRGFFVLTGAKMVASNSVAIITSSA